MSSTTVVTAAVVGAVLGGGLVRPVVAAYARPAPAPPARECSACGTRVLGGAGGWFAALAKGRCVGCGARVGCPPGVAEVVTALAFGGVVAGGAPGWLLAAQLWFALVGAALVLVDAAVRRLPDHLTAAAALGLAALLAGATVSGQPWSVAGRVVAGAAVVGALFFVAVLAGAVAFGDFKLSPALGALLAWTSWQAVVAGLLASIFLAPLLVLGALVVERPPGRRALWPVLAVAGLAAPGAVGVAVARATGTGALGVLTAWAMAVLLLTVVLLVQGQQVRGTRVAVGPALIAGSLLASIALA